jgi:hypothetical protein
MLTRWFVTRAEYDELRCDLLAMKASYDDLAARVDKLEADSPEAHISRIAANMGVTELRRPPNTWRTRSTNFTKRSQSDPSTFPNESEAK